MTCLGVTSASFSALNSLWNDLLSRHASRNIFLTREWQEAWWDEFGNDADLRLLTIGAPDSPLGIAPMQLQGDRLSFLGETDLFDYHDFIPADPAFYPVFFDCIESEPWRTLDLVSVPGWSPTFDLLPQAAVARGYAVTVEQEDLVPGVTLPGSWDDYLAALRKKDRHELRRKLRRLESAGAVEMRLADAATLDGDLRIFQEMMAESREEKRDFLSPERAAFFERAMHRMHDAGWLRLFLLMLDGEAVAAVVSFDYAGRRFLYNSGYRHGYSHLSVGLMLKALCIRDAIERGLTYFDLLRGDEPYKYHLGAADMAIHRIVVTR